MAQDNWLKIEDVSGAKLTPMLRQYVEAKAETEGSILFFRMGDFFEMFFDDAIEASEILGLALTSRDGPNKAERIPMAGVPARSVDGYVARLIKAGKTVALCDQVEDPKEAKGLVKRSVVQTVTAGTAMAPELLEERTNNYLASVWEENGRAGLALVDVSTGELLVAQLDHGGDQLLVDELARMAPAEVLLAKDAAGGLHGRLRNRFESATLTERPDDDFDTAHARDLITGFFDLSTLRGLELDDAREALGAAGALLTYVKETHRDAVPTLRLPRRYDPGGYVVLDGNTQRNLELVESLMDKGRRGTLLHVLDRTHTSMGARKLRQWILHPLLDLDALRGRHFAVEDLFSDGERRMALGQTLKAIGDMERLLGRITSKSGNARDVKALGRAIGQVPGLKDALEATEAPLLGALRNGMDPLDDVEEWIGKAVTDEPPLAITEGNILKEGHDAELDRLRGLVRGGRDWIATLQRDESERTGIAKLKVGYNKVFGYYIEVSKGNAHRVPEDYERKQTLVNAERYITPGLKSREEEIVTAQESMERLEYELFVKLRRRIAGEALRIHDTADAIASVDVLLSLAEVAVSRDYCKPEVNDSDELYLRDSRHPVVEDLMMGRDFVPNDVHLDRASASMLIVTGPNMAGKSTYLRQVALSVLMAQIGSFVPAAEARLGVVDRIFTRVGASDNLVRGESTFMVEMIETASILNSATPRSLLVLDEIGRGTSTFDGISIAWSVAEHIHDRVGAKTLFATHYHELTELGHQLPLAKNVNVAVREWSGKVVFLYRIIDGGADHSYGIQVAKLAGLPREVIARAQEILQSLESGNPAVLGMSEQMYLFGPPRPAEPGPVEKELQAVNPDDLSPREAHELVRHLKKLVEEGDG